MHNIACRNPRRNTSHAQRSQSETRNPAAAPVLYLVPNTATCCSVRCAGRRQLASAQSAARPRLKQFGLLGCCLRNLSQLTTVGIYI